MKQQLFVVICGLALSVASVASMQAQDSNSAERFFGYLDRNKDGRIDGDEVKRMPSSVREGFQDSDISLDRGISKDTFVREMPRIMERMRKKREEERDRRSRDDDRSRDSRDSNSRQPEPQKTSKSFTYTPRKKVRVTMEIPSRFEEGDSDGDGQIGLYEWREWKPNERFHFPVYDLNQDGFLTPRELSNPPSKDEIDQYLASLGISVPQTVSSRPSAGPGPRGPQRSPQTVEISSTTASSRGTPSDEKQPQQEIKQATTPSKGEEPADPLEKTARVFFSSMDADKNGSITPEEWARSRRLKPKFEEAGVDLSQPMNQEQFIESYLKVYSES